MERQRVVHDLETKRHGCLRTCMPRSPYAHQETSWIRSASSFTRPQLNQKRSMPDTRRRSLPWSKSSNESSPSVRRIMHLHYTYRVERFKSFLQTKSFNPKITRYVDIRAHSVKEINNTCSMLRIFIHDFAVQWTQSDPGATFRCS